MSSNIEQEIKTIISKVLDIDIKKINKNSDVVNDLGADSLDSVEIIMFTEDKYGLSIPDDEAFHIKTVGQLIDYVKKELKE